jgi:hypothetical protein
MFYNVAVGDHILSLPKPPLYGLIGAGMRRSIDAMRGRDHAFDGFARDLSQEFAPPMPIVGGPVPGLSEDVVNWNPFFGNHIIPPNEEGVSLSLRHFDGASNAGKWLSEASQAMGMGVDPRYFDAIMAADGGKFGQTIMAASNLTTDRPDKWERLASTLEPFTTGVPGEASPVIQRAQTLATKYGDADSIDMRRVNAILQESYGAKDLTQRNQLVAKAWDVAARARDFYERNGDEMLAYRRAEELATRAQTDLNNLPPRDRAAFAEANRPALRAGAIIDAYAEQVNALRTARANAQTSKQIDAIDQRLRLIWSRAVDAVGDTPRPSAPSLTKPPDHSDDFNP